MTTKNLLKARVSKKRTINIYATLWDGSKKLLELLQTAPRGSKWPLWMGSLIFTAFSFEAYLNHIGPKLFACWEIIEKAINPDGKLDVVCEKLGIYLSKDKRPRQTIHNLFKFRNYLAHGKTETLGPNETLRNNDQYQYLEKFIDEPLRPTWEKYCNERNANRAREDIEQVIQLIHEKIKGDNDPLFFSGLIEASASLHQESQTGKQS